MEILLNLYTYFLIKPPLIYLLIDHVILHLLYNFIKVTYIFLNANIIHHSTLLKTLGTKFDPAIPHLNMEKYMIQYR